MKNNLLIIMLLAGLVSFGQRAFDPIPKDVILAKKLKKQFEDDDIAILSSSEKVEFKYDRKKDKVSALHSIDEKLMNLDLKKEILRYHFYDGQREITKFAAYYRTKRPILAYAKDEAYSSRGIFHNNTRVKYINLNFPLQGYTYLTKFRENIKDVKYLTQIYFTDEYPVISKTIKIVVPDWMNVELKEFNFEGYDIQKKVYPNKKKTAKVYEFTAKNLPAMFKDDSEPGPTYLYPHILVLSKSHTAGKETKRLFENTQDLYNWYKSLVGQLKNNREPFKQKVNDLVANAKNDDEKIKNIFYWVQDNIRYIAFEDGIAGFKPAEAEDVYKKRYGDCKGMANLTKEMLKEAGFDARLTWIGTRRIAYDYSTPSLAVDNHMICTLVKGKDTIFLDATEKYNPLGEYAFRIQGQEAMIENGDSFILKKVPEKDASVNKEILTYNLKLEGDNLTGKVEKKYTGESRTGLLYSINNLKNSNKDEIIKKFLSKDNTNYKVSNVQISDVNNRDVPFSFKYDLSIKNAVSSFDGETYINLNIDNDFANFKLKEKRKHPYQFSYREDSSSKTILEIPAGYKVQYLPESISEKTKDFDLSVSFKQQGNKIIYNKKFVNKTGRISPENFEKWNNFIDKLKKIYNDQIVLVK